MAESKFKIQSLPSELTPQGFMLNGKISRTVASNNLTVAIKTLAGNDPSASDPVYVRIGDTVKTLTAALSLTLNAGTNWMNAGAADLATYEIDYFVYLGIRASDSSVFIGVSRIPYGLTYANFNATSTHDKHLAYSGSAPASTDGVEVVGRYNATLSATASFNWSVPSTSVLINRPIHETRMLEYNPTFTGFSTAVGGSQLYRVSGNMCFLATTDGTQGTSNSTAARTMKLPLRSNIADDFSYVGALVLDNTAWQTTPGHVRLETADTTILKVGKAVHLTAWTAAGTAGFCFEIWYPI